MKFIPPVFKRIGVVVLVLGLAGCAAATDTQQHTDHHPGAKAGSTSPMGGMMDGCKMGAMDMKSVCEMHSKMMTEKTPQEHKAMMEAHHGKMSAEDMQKHMDMMKEKCR
ncbi:hypothetical protein [Oxalicibacterium faecigallinarum]|uniref:Lipoprotein n=1 Tax=Oxalicibacterium faecigallinarum TaxID=573741 RepID=A0A8J3F1G6_9BURK|nr:hypothetical protein [Oxalicibacterium faecigallinarum]GGI16939.1 hypothetical protein GCM10008066_06470 [Oxalicibacterium faecigallinarum]